MKLLCAVLLFVFSIVAVAFADIELPAPKTEGGIGVFDAIEL